MNELPVNADSFRQAVGQFCTGVTVVTVVADGQPHGMTVNAFTSVSLQPLLVLVCIEQDAVMHDLLARSGAFAATILSADQEPESVWFSSPRPAGYAEFADVEWTSAPVSGAPVLTDGLAYLDCDLIDRYAGGDHTIYLGIVTAVGQLHAADPLVYFDSDYRRLRR